MNKTTEQVTTIPGRSAGEERLLRLLEQFSTGGMGQLGDLSKLAQGIVGSPTGEDQKLIAQSIERARQLAQQQLEIPGAILGAQGREDLLSRGASGASAEVLSTLLNKLGTQQSISQAVLQAQQQGGEALLNLPFQRAGVQLGANQALFQRILGGATPVLSSLLQERIAQPTTTETSKGFSYSDLAKLGKVVGAIGAAPFTGGASLAALGIPTGSGGG